MALRPKLNFVVNDPASGKARPGAWVTIYDANTVTKVPLYADDDVTSLANPVQANALGQVAFRVAPGIYDVSMTWDGAVPTVVEDVVAWTPEAAVMTSPGDLIVGGPAGAPTRMPAGVENTVLITHQGLPGWWYLQSDYGLPHGSTGSLLGYGGLGYAVAIPPGMQDQALVMSGGMPTWASLLPAGTVMPISQPGDLVVGAPGTGLPARLAAGTVGQVLTAGDPGMGLVWDSPGKAGPGQGQCYLKLDGPNLRLIPLHGNQLWIGHRSWTIPDAGVILAPTGLSPHTNYYVYAAHGVGMFLEASTIPFAVTGGYYYKSGDLTRALVGYCHFYTYDETTPAFVDDDKIRGLLSFFNQDERSGSSKFTAPRSTSSTTAVEIHDEIRCYFIAWGFTQVQMGITGSAYTNTPYASWGSFLALDFEIVAGSPGLTAQGQHRSNIGTSITKVLGASNNLHMITLYGNTVAPAVVTWHGEAGVLACRTHFTISL